MILPLCGIEMHALSDITGESDFLDKTLIHNIQYTNNKTSIVGLDSVCVICGETLNVSFIS